MLDVGGKFTISRERLIRRVLSCREPIVVIQAAAGMGKSALLGEIAQRLSLPLYFSQPAAKMLSHDRPMLWDIPPNPATYEPLHEHFVCGKQRLIIAKREETHSTHLRKTVCQLAIREHRRHVTKNRDRTPTADADAPGGEVLPAKIPGTAS